MENVTSVGIDLSKQAFHFHAVNHQGRVVFRKQVQRSKLLKEVRQLPKSCTVYIEATKTAHYWARQFKMEGLETKQIPPQLVKPYVKSQKNDFNDAEAICEAGGRPSMRFVPLKSEEQIILQQIHRVRERLVRERTGLINQIRSFLGEHGIVLTLGPRAVRSFLAKEPSVPLLAVKTFAALREELLVLDQRILNWERELEGAASQYAEIRRLCSIPGLGVLTASALISSHGDFKSFHNGRQFAAWLGLVPAQFSSGGKTKLLGITKRGNVYVRKLLVHGARAVIRHALKKADPHSLWIQKLHQRKGTKLAAIALANKNARIAWKLIVSTEQFDAQSCHGN